MISITTNLRGTLNELDGPALVKTFNDLASSETGKELKAKPVQRFADRETGIKRIEALRSSIKAREEGLSTTNDDEHGLEAFKARAGTNRYKLLQLLWERRNQQVPIELLIAATYGKADPTKRGALMMVMMGVLAMIKKYKLPYTVRKEGKSYGLYDN
jgi:hypothetical protein